MIKYIDKADVVAEIERRISVLKANESVISMLAGGMFVNEFKDLLSFLNTLEVKEVNLDFENELYKAFGQVKDFTLGMRIAKHFFELGMRQSKNYNNNEE